MTLNRRQWLKSAGLTSGLFSVMGAQALSAPTFQEFLHQQEVLHYPPNTLIKLSSNENPYGPSKKVREAITKGFDSVCRYPWQERVLLREKLAEKEGVTPGHILITVGSTEGLKITALAYGLHGGEVIAGSPTFETMLYYAENFGAYVNRVPVKENTLVLDLEEMEKRISGNTRLIFLCNPNNPTGTILPADRLKDFCSSACKKTMVFSDEAYYDYITIPNYPSMVELVKENRNVIVSRTFSKVYGLAGIRIGYLVARPDIIKRLKKCQADRPNMLALHAALAAMDERDFYDYSLDMNAKARQKIYNALDQLGLEYVQSHTNFVFFKTGRNISDFNQS
ncbi:MAG: histidinol-phosphate transaminase, partial [Bacteroidota bacterium]